MTATKIPNATRRSGRRVAVAATSVAGIALTVALFGGHGAAGAATRFGPLPQGTASCPTSSYAGGTLALSGPAAAGQSSSLPPGAYTAGDGGLVPCDLENTNVAVETRATHAMSLTVTATNDAAGSGYGRMEFSNAPGSNVAFQIVVKNTSDKPVRITGLTDAWPGRSAFTPNCASPLAGTRLRAGASATCRFTVERYAPVRGTSRTSTIDVTVCDIAASRACATVASTSEVITAAATGSASATALSGAR